MFSVQPAYHEYFIKQRSLDFVSWYQSFALILKWISETFLSPLGERMLILDIAENVLWWRMIISSVTSPQQRPTRAGK